MIGLFDLVLVVIAMGCLYFVPRKKEWVQNFRTRLRNDLAVIRANFQWMRQRTPSWSQVRMLVTSDDFDADLIKDYALLKLREWARDYLDCGRLEADTRTRTFRLTYYRGIQRFVYLFPLSRGALQIMAVSGVRLVSPPSSTDNPQVEEDITEEFFGYLGPDHNFHGREMTPYDLGYESVKITFLPTSGLGERAYSRAAKISVR